MIRDVWIAALLAFACTAAQCQIAGIGAMSCRQYLTQSANERSLNQLALLEWSQGFMSALNVLRVERGKAPKRLGGAADAPSPADQLARIESFCRTKAGANLAAAVVDTYRKLPANSKD
jgi:hypothetical protein